MYTVSTENLVHVMFTSSVYQNTTYSIYKFATYSLCIHIRITLMTFMNIINILLNYITVTDNKYSL